MTSPVYLVLNHIQWLKCFWNVCANVVIVTSVGVYIVVVVVVVIVFRIQFRPCDRERRQQLGVSIMICCLAKEFDKFVSKLFVCLHMGLVSNLWNAKELATLKFLLEYQSLGIIYYLPLHYSFQYFLSLCTSITS